MSAKTESQGILKTALVGFGLVLLAIWFFFFRRKR